MDETDEKILAKLVENSRMPISKISAQTGIPDSTVSNRLKKLEKSNIIDKYTTILNPEELGINVAAIIIIQTETEKHENVEKEQGIIGQEIGMYDDDPGFSVYFNASSM